MKILLTSDAVGGVWTYSLELCGALAPHKVQVILATMGPAPDVAKRQQVAQLPNVILETSRYKLEWMDDPWRDVDHAGEWLMALEQQYEPDLIHLNGYAHAALPWRRPVVCVAHSCVCSWWRAVKGEAAPGAWDTYRQRVGHGLQRADLIVAPSHDMLDALRREYGPVDSARVIYNGRSPGAFAPAKKEPLILSAGRMWDEAKNIAALDAIAPRVPWPIHVAGDGGESASRLHHLGKLSQEQLADRLARSAIYCLPARYEPFGLSALEAALSGCALVLGDIPSLREIWDDAALYADPNDPQHMREQLMTLIESPLRRTVLANRAAERARDLTPQRMASEYLSAYRELDAQQDAPEHLQHMLHYSSSQLHA